MCLLNCPELQFNHQVQEEDATKLQFGEFADGEALTLTDVQALLLHARSVPGAPPPPDNKYADRQVVHAQSDRVKADKKGVQVDHRLCGRVFEFNTRTHV